MGNLLEKNGMKITVNVGNVLETNGIQITVNADNLLGQLLNENYSECG